MKCFYIITEYNNDNNLVLLHQMRTEQQAALEAKLTKQMPSAAAAIKQMVVCPKCEAESKSSDQEPVCEHYIYKYRHPTLHVYVCVSVCI
jgi:hypothetical protein